MEIGGSTVSELRVLIVDDHDLFRAGVKGQLPPEMEGNTQRASNSKPSEWMMVDASIANRPRRRSGS